jgi:hypothetical protein
MRRLSAMLAAVLLLTGCGASPPGSTSAGEAPGGASPGPLPIVDATSEVPAPDETVKLIFIHHSTGEAWLADESGGLGLALRDNNYFVSDTNYGWGPTDSQLGGAIGDYTDIGNWWNWFLGPSSGAIMRAVYSESAQNSSYSRLGQDPGGENQVVVFKSCFPNSHIEGGPEDPPTTGRNPLEGAGLDGLTVANAKGLYIGLLEYFGGHTDKLFVVVTAPPLLASETSPEAAANARALNTWLVNDWLADYPHSNVAVFDFYNVLTSEGNHHRYRDGRIEYVTDQGSDTSAYASDGDSHPTPAGGAKATAEFVPLLNLFYQRWREGQA